MSPTRKDGINLGILPLHAKFEFAVRPFGMALQDTAGSFQEPG